jgi:heat-inducible transcriptional repressor
VKHVEVVSVGASRVVLVVITSSGRVHQHLVELPLEVDEDQLAAIRSRLNEAAVGRPPSEVAARAEEVVTSSSPRERSAVGAVMSALLQSLVDDRDQRVALAGTANLTPLAAHDALRPVLEALEEQVVLLRLLNEASRAPSGVSVVIGHELPVEQLATTSIVTTGYGEAAGRLGVIGPTRMDYPGAIVAVQAVAAYLSRVLEESP